MKSKWTYFHRFAIPIMVLVFVLDQMQAFGQNSDCATAISVCNATYDENNSPSGTGNVFEMAPGSCQTGGEFNSAWYVFSPQDDGVLSFILEPNNNNDDYDWSLFDITDNGCSGINTGNSPEVSCNSYGETGGFQGPTGISSAEGGSGNNNGPGNTNGPAFNADLVVQSGSVYALVIMNYSSTLNGYTLDFGSSASSIYDETAPSIVSAAINCSRDELILTFDENINLANVLSASVEIFLQGNLYTSISVSSQSSAQLDNVLVVQFAAPIPAGTASIQASPSASIADVCDNAWQAPFQLEITQVVEITDVLTDDACNGIDGSFEVIANGDNGPFEMTVNNTPMNGLAQDGLAPDTYVILVTDLEGCTSEVTISIEDVVITVDVGDDLVLCDMSVAVAGTVNAGNLLWTGPSDLTFSSTSSAQPTVTADDPGTYNLTLISTLGDCSAQDTQSIEFNLPPQINTTITPVTCATYCDGQLEVTNNNNAAVTYSFLGQVIIGTNALFDQLCGTTSLLEVDFGGDCIASYPITINSPPSIDVSIEVNEQILDLPLHEVICIGQATNADSIAWTVQGIPGLTYNALEWALELPQEAGYYQIQLFGFDEAGCSSLAQTTVLLRDEFRFFIPNSFTPNGDGINDIFLPLFTYWPNAYEMCIYDRWGSCIWRTSNPTEAWTGDVHSGAFFAHDNTYNWVMRYQDQSLEAQIVFGQVVMIR